jgi:hypothetical protein
MLIQVKSRWDSDKVLFAGDYISLQEAMADAIAKGTDLSGAYLDGAYLGGANLRGANLRGAYLDGANLRGANLGEANLGEANLRGANLGEANLRGANLGGANLGGANLGEANLRGAYLRGAKINWQSHTLLGHLLFRATGQDIDKRKIAGLISISTDWCWNKFLSMDDPMKEWALDTLAKYVTEDDGAPEEIHAIHQNPNN